MYARTGRRLAGLAAEERDRLHVTRWLRLLRLAGFAVCAGALRFAAAAPPSGRQRGDCGDRQTGRNHILRHDHPNAVSAWKVMNAATYATVDM